MFNAENFPFGEFGETEESIITGVVQYIVGRGYNPHECVSIIIQVLRIYRDMKIIEKFKVGTVYRRGIKCLDVFTDKLYEFGPDGRLYVKHYHFPNYKYKPV